MRILRQTVLSALLLLATGLPVRAEPATVAEVLALLGFPASAEKSVLAGEFAETDIESSNERELAVGLAFLVKVPPKALVEKLRGQLLFKVDPNAITYGRIAGGVSDFKKLRLSAGGKAQAKLYFEAEPGDDLNLSTEEIAAFRALKGKPVSALEDQIRKQLLARYKAYRAKGLDGIAPYARDGGERSAAADLESASRASAGLEKHSPAFHDALLGYPKVPDGTQESFSWSSYSAHGTPVFILTHGFFLEEGGAIAVCQRQFYVSGSYNAEQAVGAFFPVAEGTVVAYVNRTSTDQVTGFGGSAKRSIGSGLLASQLEGLFEDLQKAAVE